MDACMVDITIRTKKVGDEVNIRKTYLLTELSDKLGTIPYEILTSVSPRETNLF